MKRKILFRGKRIDNGEWKYGYLISPEFAPERKFIGYLFADEAYAVDIVEVDPETVGQYTGLVTEDGKRVFEDDIIKFLPYEWFLKPGEHLVGIVKFGIAEIPASDPYEFSKSLCFYLECKAENSDGTVYGENLVDPQKMDLCEVIGNIHDNPELLEVLSETDD